MTRWMQSFAAMKGWRRAAIAILSGVLLVGAQAPFDIPLFGFLSFPVLVWLLDGIVTKPAASWSLRTISKPFWIGWCFGFGYFVAGLWWIGNALLVEADSFAWAVPLAVLALPGALAIFYGFATALAYRLWSEGIGRIAALAAAFALAEWFRGILFTGFPWNPIGYALMPTPMLMQSSVLISLVGLNALAVFIFAVPALLASSRRHLVIGAVIAVALLAGHVGYGTFRLSKAAAPAETLPVRLVQPSILQSEKWDRSARDTIFSTYLSMSSMPSEQGFQPELIIWPETAAPFILNERPDALGAIGQMLDPQQMLLVGAVRSQSEGGRTRYFNSVIAVDTNGEIKGLIDKVHLVPFGEYLPLTNILERLGLTKIVALPENFSSGDMRPILGLPRGISAVAFICYEIIFDGVVRRDAQGKDVIINVTNDAWFGDTPGPRQHFRQAQLRAVETGLPVIRAANNGISGAIDGYGRVVSQTKMNEVMSLDVEVPVGMVRVMQGFEPVLLGWLIFGGLVLTAGAARKLS